MSFMDNPKQPEYLNNKINYLETNCKNTNITYMYKRINEFNKGYKPGTKLVERWVRHVACIKEKRNAYRVFMGKL
jgi:hypothetical protein